MCFQVKTHNWSTVLKIWVLFWKRRHVIAVFLLIFDSVSVTVSRNYNVILGQKLIVGLQVDIKRNILKQEVT